ncbi:MAG: M67 family metallopeptidase [Rhodospirillaceae bacterium]|nr:M67 family metallopeptidase [Rhodospirillaceae bacterium]
MITIPENFLDIIRTEAEAAFPNECCGLLVGTENASDKVVTRVVPSPNTKVDSEGTGHKNFEIDPKIHFDLLRELKDGSENIVGHYHSHPGKPALPSAHDIDNALEPEHIWLIMDVDENGRAAGLGAFHIDGENGNVGVVEITVPTLDAG